MVCVRGVRPACKAGVDGRAALYRVLLGFNQERAAALTDDKAVAVRIKRTAGVLGIIVAARKRLGLRETGHNDRAEDARRQRREQHPPRRSSAAWSRS